MKEIWKPVPITGYATRYIVSNFGRMQSLGNVKKILKPKTYENGYIKVNMTKNAGKTKILRGVHRLVALAFIANPQNKNCINHKDNNPKNNHISNLEWVTHKENMAYQVMQGRHVHGIRSPFAKLNDFKVLQIRKSPLSQTQLAKIFGVSPTTIKYAITRKSWKHI